MPFGGGPPPLLGSRPSLTAQPATYPLVPQLEPRIKYTVAPTHELPSRTSTAGAAAPIVLYPPQERLVATSPQPQPQPQPDASPSHRPHRRRRAGPHGSPSPAAWRRDLSYAPAGSHPRHTGTTHQLNQQQSQFADALQQPLAVGSSVLALGCPTGPDRVYGYLSPVLSQVLQFSRWASSHSVGASPSVKVLVLSPSREAAEMTRQVASELGNRQGQHVQVVCGRSPLLEDVASLRAACPDVLVATPGRAMQLLTQAPRGCKLDELFGDLQVVVVDGAMQLMGQPAVRSQVEAVMQGLSHMLEHRHKQLQDNSVSGMHAQHHHHHHQQRQHQQHRQHRQHHQHQQQRQGYQLPVDILALTTNQQRGTGGNSLGGVALSGVTKTASRVQVLMIEQSPILPPHVTAQVAATMQLLTRQPITPAHLTQQPFHLLPHHLTYPQHTLTNTTHQEDTSTPPVTCISWTQPNHSHAVTNPMAAPLNHNAHMTTSSLDQAAVVAAARTSNTAIPNLQSPHQQRLLIVPETDLALQLVALLRAHAEQRPRHRVLVLCPTIALLRVWARVARQLGHKVLELHGRRAQPAAAALLDTFNEPPPRPMSTSVRRRRVGTAAGHGRADRRRLSVGGRWRRGGVREAAGGSLAMSVGELGPGAEQSGGGEGEEEEGAAGLPLSLDTPLDSGDGDEPEMSDAVSAPGLVLFSAGGATSDQVFPHMTMMIQVGIPRHPPQFSDYQSHTLHVAMHPTHPNTPTPTETILLVSEAEVPGLPALHNALNPNNPSIPSHTRTADHSSSRSTTTTTTNSHQGHQSLSQSTSQLNHLTDSSPSQLPTQQAHHGTTPVHSPPDPTSSSPSSPPSSPSSSPSSPSSPYLLSPRRQSQTVRQPAQTIPPSIQASKVTLDISSQPTPSTSPDKLRVDRGLNVIGPVPAPQGPVINGDDAGSTGFAGLTGLAAVDSVGGVGSGGSGGDGKGGRVGKGSMGQRVRVVWQRSAPVASGQLHDKVHVCMSNIMTVLREVAWTSWMSHLRLHPLVPTPPPDVWMRLCDMTTISLALPSTPAIHKHVANVWGQAYVWGLTVKQLDERDVREVPPPGMYKYMSPRHNIPPSHLLIQNDTHTSTTTSLTSGLQPTAQSGAAPLADSAVEIDRQAISALPRPVALPTMPKPTATAIGALSSTLPRTHVMSPIRVHIRPSRTLLSYRMMRQYMWSYGMHRSGDVPQEAIMRLVTARLARKMQRARKMYVVRLRAMRARGKARRALLRGKGPEEQGREE